MSITIDKPNQRHLLYEKMYDHFETANLLNRRLVSFQANKQLPLYRWFKYKEGFSSTLVSFFLKKFNKMQGRLLDPFAGMGTTLFTGQELGWETVGIELLPVGVFAITAREAAALVNVDELKNSFEYVWRKMPKIVPKHSFHHLSITKDAFPEETEEQLNRYISVCNTVENDQIKTVLKFAAFSILEEISFTRKDGQYLRWDYRSKRNLSGKPFDKGKIFSFNEAVKNKIEIIINDLSSKTDSPLFHGFDDELPMENKPPIRLYEGSSLDILPKLEADTFDFIMTSPPYCNRYDYTRTYALELLYLGKNENDVRELRQSMLSCTVENKTKMDYLEKYYQSLKREDVFQQVQKVYDKNSAMGEVNEILEKLNRLELLNNKNIPRMVKNYFFEMCIVIAEMSRLLKSQGYCVMVNDNVRYGGEEIPVDLILSRFAESFGFNVRCIYVLPQAKGNSSQQMGNYGRSEIRKCVYLWQKK